MRHGTSSKAAGHMSVRGETATGRSWSSSTTTESVFTWTVFLYVVIRALPVWRGLQEGSVNPWIFLGLDIATAWPYAKSWPRLFRALRSRQFDQTVVWSLVLLGSLLTPYVYVAAVGDGVAVWVWVVLVAFLTIALVGAAARIWKAVHDQTE